MKDSERFRATPAFGAVRYLGPLRRDVQSSPDAVQHIKKSEQPNVICHHKTGGRDGLKGERRQDHLPSSDPIRQSSCGKRHRDLGQRSCSDDEHHRQYASSKHIIQIKKEERGQHGSRYSGQELSEEANQHGRTVPLF
ncbi:hypothetical protein BHT46_04565 [Bacillus licheniformis]|nr:hypothetical protein BHT46_04565 [Bacillus licheniformis]